MVDDVNKNYVFESTSVGGVKVNYAPASWGMFLIIPAREFKD